MLAIMEALEDWCQYLLGAKHRVEVWTDHLSLTYFRQAQKLDARHAGTPTSNLTTSRWSTSQGPW